MIFHDRPPKSPDLIGEALFEAYEIGGDVGVQGVRFRAEVRAQGVHFRADVGDVRFSGHRLLDTRNVAPHFAENRQNEIFGFGHRQL